MGTYETEWDDFRQEMQELNEQEGAARLRLIEAYANEWSRTRKIFDDERWSLAKKYGRTTTEAILKERNNG